MKTLYQVLHLKILGMAIYLCYIICKYFNKTFNLIFSTFKTGCKHTFEDIKYQEFTLRFFNHIKQGMPSHPFPKWYLCLHRRLFATCIWIRALKKVSFKNERRSLLNSSNLWEITKIAFIYESCHVMIEITSLHLSLCVVFNDTIR